MKAVIGSHNRTSKTMANWPYGVPAGTAVSSEMSVPLLLTRRRSFVSSKSLSFSMTVDKRTAQGGGTGRGCHTRKFTQWCQWRRPDRDWLAGSLAPRPSCKDVLEGWREAEAVTSVTVGTI